MSALSSHQSTLPRRYAEDYPHETDCAGSYCAACGCCVHCTDCDCAGCTDHACDCWTWRGEPA